MSGAEKQMVTIDEVMVIRDSFRNKPAVIEENGQTLHATVNSLQRKSGVEFTISCTRFRERLDDGKMPRRTRWFNEDTCEIFREGDVYVFFEPRHKITISGVQ